MKIDKKNQAYIHRTKLFISLVLLIGIGFRPTFEQPKLMGGNFISLQWVGADQNLPYILRNLENSTVQSKLNNTFREFRAKGFNVISLLIAPDWPGFIDSLNLQFPLVQYYSSPTHLDSLDSTIDRVNRLSLIASQYKLKTVIRLSPPQVSSIHNALHPTNTVPSCSDPSSPGPHPPTNYSCADLFNDSSTNYQRTKNWIARWHTKLDMSLVDHIEISAEPTVFTPFHDVNSNRIMFYGAPHLHDSCMAAYMGTCASEKQGAWVMNLYHWYDSAYYGEKFGIELKPNLGAAGSQKIDSSWFGKLGNWIGDSLPHVGVASLEIYYDSLPLPSSDTAYYLKTKYLLGSYLNSNAFLTHHIPLWLDEYGMSNCNIVDPTCPQDEDNQDRFYSGTLRAIREYNSSQVAGGSLWAASNDSSFDTRTWGLFRGYDVDNRPVPRKGWSQVQLYLPKPYLIPTNFLPLILK